MDKYEYNLKLEEIDKLVDQNDYQEAANLADSIDWRRVRNVRTLCLISEIYEASGRLEDSKRLLLRAYRRSPVGRTVLYRLVEVTTEMQEYDEAMQYYSEYVQAAPHDNNRYILKYKIYKGKGSPIEEQISILEEYLGQEYTERWAYELAVLYQKAGQTQKSLAACDDLVLWFHSGKYVKKALELKKRYASLTPKQQQIYEECVHDLQVRGRRLEAEDAYIPKTSDADGEMLAESIIAETEKMIADQVMAHKAAMEKNAEKESRDVFSEPTTVIPTTVDPALKEAISDEQKGTSEKAAEDADGKENDIVEKPYTENLNTPVMNIPPQAVSELVPPVAPNPIVPQRNPEDLQIELAKTMRKIVAGVVKRTEEHEEDIPAALDPKFQTLRKIELPQQQEQVASKLSIDDILLSMSDQGRKVADAVLSAPEEPEEEPVKPEEIQEQENNEEEESVRIWEKGMSVSDAAAEDLTDVQREALQYTSNPERLLKKKKALPTYMEEIPDEIQDDLGNTRKIENTREALKAAAERELLAEQTRRIPTEEIAQIMKEKAAEAEPETVTETVVEETAEEEITETTEPIAEIEESNETAVEAEAVTEESREAAAETEAVTEESREAAVETEAVTEESREAAAETEAVTEESNETEAPAEETPAAENGEVAEIEAATAIEEDVEPAAETIESVETETAVEETAEPIVEEAAVEETSDAESDAKESVEAETVEPTTETEETTETDAAVEIEELADSETATAEETPVESEKSDKTENQGELPVITKEIEDDPVSKEHKNNIEKVVKELGELAEEEEKLFVPDHLRPLFRGFTEVEGLEDQIANAIIQAEANVGDRTSRSGNILIFGSHSTGKTTLAMNLAKAIAQDKGNQVVKMAKIYAADLNRKDIAATVAKIAGGTLIIEEAGDLEDTTIDQLTTAMEFRTDGLVVILEDEQQYMHELLMKHPRFTMKFTAQIYIPVYAVEELANFGQIYANAQDFTIGMEANEVLCQKISDLAAAGEVVSIADVIGIVDKAISRSNKFFRKISMGKKRYDENDYVVLFPKDFR